MDNLIIEIKRNLELMGVSEKLIILEQRKISDGISDGISELINNAIKAAKSEDKKAKDIISFGGGRETTLKQIEGLLERMRKFESLDVSEQIESLSLLDKIFPDKVTKSFFDVFVSGGEADILGAVSQHQPKIKTVEELKNWLKINGDFDEKEANMAANILGDKFLKRADNYGRHLEELETNPKAEFDGFTTDEAKAMQSERIDKASDTGRGGDDVTDAGRAGDDIDTPNASRTDVDGEREIVQKKDIDPNDENYTIDGRRIIYDANGNPKAAKKIEKIEPKDPEPIETPDPTEPELRIPDVPERPKSLTNLADELKTADEQFRQRNKKLFDALSDNIKKLDDETLSTSEKAKAEREIKKISKKLTRQWNRTFLNFQGKQSYKEMIDWFNLSKRNLSKDDKEIIDDILNKLKTGLPEDFFEELNRWGRFKKNWKVISEFLIGIRTGVRSNSSGYRWLRANLGKAWQYFKKDAKRIETWNELYPEESLAMKTANTIERAIGSPTIIKKLRDASQSDLGTQRKVAKFLGELIGGVGVKAFSGTLLLSFFNSVAGRIEDDGIAEEIDRIKEKKRENPDYKLKEKEIEFIALLIMDLIERDYDIYVTKEFMKNKLGGGETPVNIILNFLDDIDDKFDGLEPLISNIKTRRMMLGEALSIFDVDHTRFLDENRESVLESIKGQISNYLETGEWNDVTIDDNDEIMENFILSIGFDANERIEMFLSQMNELDTNLENVINSTVLKMEGENMRMYITIKSDEKFDGTDEYIGLGGKYNEGEIDNIINQYIQYDNNGFYLTGVDDKKYYIKKFKDKFNNNFVISTSNGSEPYLTFYDALVDNKKYFKKTENETMDESVKNIGLISVLIKEQGMPNPSQDPTLPDSGGGTGSGGGTDSGSDSGSSGSSGSGGGTGSGGDTWEDRINRLGSQTNKSKEGNFTYLKDSSSEIKDDIKENQKKARLDAGSSYKPFILVTLENPSDFETQKLVLAGTSEVDGSEVQYDVVQNDDGKWGWKDNTGDEANTPVWKPFSEYKIR